MSSATPPVRQAERASPSGARRRTAWRADVPRSLPDLLDDLRDLVDEPRIDPGGGGHRLDPVAARARPVDQVQPALGAVHDRRERICLVARHVLRAQVVAGLLQSAPRLAQRLLERAPDRHDLAHRLHRRGQTRVGLGELLEGEPGDLHHDVVEGGLERRGRLAGDVVGDLVEPVPHREQRRDLRDGEPRGLRRERARTRDPGVHLDQHLPAGLRDPRRTARSIRRSPRRSPAGPSARHHASAGIRGR